MRRGAFALGVLASWPSWSAQARAQTSAEPVAASPPPSAGEVVVRGVRRTHDVHATTVSAEEAKDTAGTEGDPVKVVYDLPGVARPAFGAGQLVVWGSSPHDTRTYVDGVEIPALFHGAALRSTVNGDLVDSVTLTPGAYGVDYGRSLGATVRSRRAICRRRRPALPRVHACTAMPPPTPSTARRWSTPP